jgi:hypothetical protein
MLRLPSHWTRLNDPKYLVESMYDGTVTTYVLVPVQSTTVYSYGLSCDKWLWEAERRGEQGAAMKRCLASVRSFSPQAGRRTMFSHPLHLAQWFPPLVRAQPMKIWDETRAKSRARNLKRSPTGVPARQHPWLVVVGQDMYIRVLLVQQYWIGTLLRGGPGRERWADCTDRTNNLSKDV